MDPVALRLQNYVEYNQKEDRPYSSPDSLRMSYERVIEAFGWLDYQRPPAQGSKRWGIGFAAHDLIAGGLPPGYAWIKLNTDGTADVITGTQDIGTGIRTGLTQIAAEELGLKLEDVRLYLGDTGTGPYAPVSAGSATLATIGPAVRDAALHLRQQLLDAAKVVLEEPSEQLHIQGGMIFSKDRPAHAVPVKEVTSRLAPHMLQGHGVCGPNPAAYSVRNFGAQCAEVEVDISTGEVTVLRVLASHDCGRIINPTLVNNQVIGGVTQGLGYALMEERIVDVKRGVVLNPNLEEYKIPTVADAPLITHAAVDIPDLRANSLGIKGIGEPPLVPTAPAIANAIHDATGVRLRHSPLSRRRMIVALAEQGSIQ
jgi:xanthine dehydrogenase YagR molybdenum-binding subunit